MGLLFLVDLAFELAVNGGGFLFVFILQSVLKHPSQVVEKPEGAHRRRPIAVAVDTVQKLLGIGIAMLGGRG